MMDGGTDRAANCSGVSPSHFSSRVIRYRSRYSARIAFSPGAVGTALRGSCSGGSHRLSYVMA